MKPSRSSDPERDRGQDRDRDHARRRRPRRRPAAALAVLAVLAIAPACSSDRPAANPDPPASPGPTLRDYTLVGVVRSVEPDAGRLTIRHEEIPGFMAAMTMPFSLDDRALLETLREGDEVEGILRVESGDGTEVKSYRLLNLEVTRPAATRLTLNLGGETPTAAPAPPLLEEGQPVPDLLMTTQDGLPLRLSDLRGRFVVGTFIYTRCPLPDFCPLMDKKFAELSARLAANPRLADSVRLLSISFDPEHDTPEVLARHAKGQNAEPPRWTFAVATHEALAAFGPQLGLKYGPVPNEILHNLVTFVIGPDGRLLRRYPGRDWSPTELARFLAQSRDGSPPD